MTHICVGKLSVIGSDNGLSPGRCQAIIWTNAGIFLISASGTNFSEILIEIRIFSFKKMGLKASSAKWQPFFLGLNVLTDVLTKIPTPSWYSSHSPDEQSISHKYYCMLTSWARLSALLSIFLVLSRTNGFTNHRLVAGVRHHGAHVIWLQCHCLRCCMSVVLTHFPLYKMAAISQTTFSDAFSWMKSFVFWLRFHWSLFLRVQLTIH